MDKVIFQDETETKALKGKLINSEDDAFVCLEQQDRIVKIAKHRIIKIEQSKGGYNESS